VRNDAGADGTGCEVRAKDLPIQEVNGTHPDDEMAG
jgi:hypothetical protein